MGGGSKPISYSLSKPWASTARVQPCTGGLPRREQTKESPFVLLEIMVPLEENDGGDGNGSPFLLFLITFCIWSMRGGGLQCGSWSTLTWVQIQILPFPSCVTQAGNSTFLCCGFPFCKIPGYSCFPFWKIQVNTCICFIKLL